jgi:L-lactate dehydrogenase complex protein LldG
MSGSRELVLGRVRAALRDVARDGAPVERGYLDAHIADDEVTGVFLDRLTDYRARAYRCDETELSHHIARLRKGSVAVPAGLPAEWCPDALVDAPPLAVAELDAVATVVTRCALAVAETGTIVLDAGPGQGRRMLTLVPDHHICVVRAEQIVASVPHAVAALDPSRPLTWFSGPSATSDIELNRVEGVHGPRTLDVLLVS